MKEQKKFSAETIGYNSMLFSAYKALIIFKLLSSDSYTKSEIKEIFKQIPYINPEISDASLRVYLNTLKSEGFIIEKSLTHKKHREYSYYITETPFKINITNEQVDKLFDLYDICTYNLPFCEFLQIDLFFRKLGKYLKNEYFTEMYKTNSKLYKTDTVLLRKLIKCCENKDVVTVMYKSPHSGMKPISIIAYEIYIQNYKLYLKGFGKEYKEIAIFLLDRIENIINIEPYDESDIKNNLPDIIYELYDFDEPLDDNEEIIELSSSCKKIRHKVFNKMLSFQRILQLGSGCKIIEPKAYKDDLLNILMKMKEVYSEN